MSTKGKLKTMDAMHKNLSVSAAHQLIYSLIRKSNTDMLEQFWLDELGKLHLSDNDYDLYDRILTLQSEVDKSEVSKALYENCIKGDILTDLLKKNWRRFFNNNIIEKFDNYIKVREKEQKIIQEETSPNILEDKKCETANSLLIETGYEEI